MYFYFHLKTWLLKYYKRIHSSIAIIDRMTTYAAVQVIEDNWNEPGQSLPRSPFPSLISKKERLRDFVPDVPKK